MCMQNNHHITLVVFPFEDLSSQKDLGIFCRSFSEDLITELSCFRQLRVIIFPNDLISNGSQKLPDLLKNGYFVKGTFRYEKETVLINVQLFDSENQHLVWGNRLEGDLTRLNEIQDNLLKSVVAVLQQQIDLNLLSKIRQRPKVAFNAYEHWLYGMEELKKASLEADLIAREHFDKALQIQPDYALACTGMSLSYFNEWTCQLWDRWDISKNGAYKWAQKAIELDEQNHVIAMVLGRVFLYEGSYNTAIFYFKRSLMLNSNDPDTLFPIALYLVYLNQLSEALELYERGLKFYPYYGGNHLRIGGFIYFELGEFEKAASFIVQNQIGKAKIADTDAYCAAIYYYLKQYDKMQIYWNSFLDTYRKLNSKGAEFTEQDAINWLLKLNPHQQKSNLEQFLQHISKGNFEKYPVQITVPKQDSVHDAYFAKESAAWKFSFDGSTIQTPEVKGYFDIQKMLTQPHQVFHCAELVGSKLDGSGEKLIDENARKQYQKKIIELQGEIEEAEQFSNFARLEKLHEEYDKLIEHLSRSLNLKGQIRQTGSPVEKARSAVTWRIRHAIARIEQHHPMLGAHLSNAVKTGTLCSYKPDRDIKWITA
jgi:TolB-like protein